MNGGLLNIWREIGAYLRYADAKCIFLSGVSFGLLFSFCRFHLISQDVGWGILKHLTVVSIPATSWVTIVTFFLAFVFSSAAAVPSLTSKSIRISGLISLGNFFSKPSAVSNIVYFRDIASLDSGESYQRKYSAESDLKTPLSQSERDLCIQIWIVSRIATAKFFSTNASLAFLLVGLVFSVF